MKHPDPQCQQRQEAFLEQLPEDKRAFHARMFRIGNASYVYHNQALSINENRLWEYYQEWLEGLPGNIASEMKKRGLEYCKGSYMFTRYVNERNDLGMRDWMKEHLSEEDYRYYEQSSQKSDNGE